MYYLIAQTSAKQREYTPGLPVMLVLEESNDKAYLAKRQKEIEPSFPNAWINDKSDADVMKAINKPEKLHGNTDPLTKQVYEIFCQSVLPNGGCMVKWGADRMVDLIHQREGRKQPVEEGEDSKPNP